MTTPKKKVKAVKAWGFKNKKSGKLSNRTVPHLWAANICCYKEKEIIVRVLITEAKEAR